jgi:hypothetical protein
VESMPLILRDFVFSLSHSGTIGFVACWCFVHKIYSSIKID